MFIHFCINDDYQTQSQPRQDSRYVRAEMIVSVVLSIIVYLLYKSGILLLSLFFFAIGNFGQRTGDFHRLSQQHRLRLVVGSTDALGEYCQQQP